MNEISVHTVVKIGGSLLRNPEHLARAGDILRALAGSDVVLVPGGGPLADAVRALDARLQLGDDAAHWMAILAMDQHAHLLASRVSSSTIVRDPAEIAQTLCLGRIPIVAPYRWLMEADPLPHSWSVTSDSIAAWIASRLHARALILLKPVSGAVNELVDEYFRSVRVGDCITTITSIDGLGDLVAQLSPSPPA